jgi:hypothetical protein
MILLMGVRSTATAWHRKMLWSKGFQCSCSEMISLGLWRAVMGKQEAMFCVWRSTTDKPRGKHTIPWTQIHVPRRRYRRSDHTCPSCRSTWSSYWEASLFTRLSLGGGVAAFAFWYSTSCCCFAAVVSFFVFVCVFSLGGKKLWRESSLLLGSLLVPHLMWHVLTTAPHFKIL